MDDTTNTRHVTGYVRQIEEAWDLAESEDPDPDRQVHVERLGDAWHVWIDEPEVLATDGRLAGDDCLDVIRCLTGWSREEAAGRMDRAEKTGKALEFPLRRSA